MPNSRLCWISSNSRSSRRFANEHRRQLIEKMASQVVEKVGTDLKKVETDVGEDSGRHLPEGEGPLLNPESCETQGRG